MHELTDTDDLLAARFAALATVDDGDWPAVRRRATTARRRRVLAAALVAGAIVAAPALGLHRTALDWFSAEPAPAREQLQFLQLGVGAPAGMDLRVIPNSARKVMTARLDGKEHTLWVAPTEGGGFCMSWSDLHGGCTADRTPPLPAGREEVGDVNPFLLAPTIGRNGELMITSLGGRLLGDGIERLTVEFADGEEAEIPFVWVSPPIDAGFYLYDVPNRHRRRGHEPIALVATDADGELVARQVLPRIAADEVREPRRLPDGELVLLPRHALPERAERVIAFRASDGQRVRLWVMPSTRGYTCYVYDGGGGCPRAGSEPRKPIEPALQGGDTVLLFARARDDVTVIELRYEDGTAERVRPAQGFVLTEIRPAHHECGHRLVAALAYDAGGNRLARQAFDPRSTGIYPCETPVDIGHGVKACP